MSAQSHAAAGQPMAYQGRCWVFGDNIGVDGDMMPFHFALSRETRLDVLREHAMTGVDPAFPAKARPGDLVVGGRRFAQGNPHIQGLLGLRALGVGLLVESIPRGSLRNAVNAGLPILPACPRIASLVKTGDELRVDFDSGQVVSLATGLEWRFPPLPEALREIVRLGGWEANFRRRLAAQGAGHAGA